MNIFYFAIGVASGFIINKLFDTIQDVIVKIYLIKQRKNEE